MSQSDKYTIADDLVREVGQHPLRDLNATALGERHGVAAESIVKVNHWCIDNGYMTKQSHSDMNHVMWCGMLTADGEEVAAGLATTRPRTNANSGPSLQLQCPCKRGNYRLRQHTECHPHSVRSTGPCPCRSAPSRRPRRGSRHGARSN